MLAPFFPKNGNTAGAVRAAAPRNPQNQATQAAPAGTATVAATPEPAKQAPTRRVLKRKGRSFTPSISDALSGRTAADEQSQEDAKTRMQYYTGEELHDPFTPEQFEAKWNQYLERLNDRPNLKATLSRIPTIGEGWKLKLQISNYIQDTEISSIKPELVSWLRKELRNTDLELITEIVEMEQSTHQPYSETERFKDMVNKNPSVNLLKQTFNLDFGDH